MWLNKIYTSLLKTNGEGLVLSFDDKIIEPSRPYLGIKT